MIPVIRFVLTGFSALLLSATMALAVEYTDAEKQALAERVQTFEQAFATNDFAAVVDVIPPKMLQFMAVGADLEPAKLREELVKLTAKSMQDVTVDNVSMNLGEIRYAQTASEAPYAMVPTDVTFTLADGTTIRSESSTLAFRDAGIWYLVRVQEGAQLVVLTEVYPEFKGLDFGKGQMTVLE